MDNLRFDRATARQASLLIHWLGEPMPKEIYPLRKYLSQCGADNFQDILALKNILAPPSEAAILPLARELFDSIIANNDCLSVKDMKINGRDLMALGYTGKDVGDTLYMLLDQVLREPKLNQKQILLNMAQTCGYSSAGM
jgi:tRNA nucleotidyltransferase (CCA-adding enzyme)